MAELNSRYNRDMLIPGNHEQTGLLALLGSEGLQNRCALLRSLLTYRRTAVKRIGLVPAALGEMKQNQREYRLKQSLEAMTALEAELSVIPLYSRLDAENETVANQLNEVDLIYIMSGQPQALVNALASTPAHRILDAKIGLNGLVITAGAVSSASGPWFPAPDQATQNSLPALSDGLCLLDGLTILPFFDWLHKADQNLLSHIQKSAGWVCGIGIETAVVFNGSTISTAGTGLVTFISPDGEQHVLSPCSSVDPLLVEAVQRSVYDQHAD